MPLLPTRTYGATGLQVSPIGLGLAALGRPGYLTLGHGRDLPADRGVDALRARAHELLDHAVARGVRYLDAARSYGEGEAFLGSWLAARDHGAVRPTVGSKWGYTYTAGWQVEAEVHEVKDHGLATFRRQLAETRERLGERLDVYQVHSATLDSGVLDDAAVLDALAGLADTGVVVGLTLSGPGQRATLERALELAAAGRAPFRSVQATYNLLEPSVAPALAAASAAGWGVTVKEAVANGRLTAAGDPPARLTDLAHELGVGVDQLALAAVLAAPWADVVLSGAVTREQLDANLGAWELTARADVGAALEELVASGELTEPAERYWATRTALPWT